MLPLSNMAETTLRPEEYSSGHSSKRFPMCIIKYLKKRKYKEMVLVKAVIRLESNNPGLRFQLCHLLAELSWPKHLNLSVSVYSFLKWQ